jgi:hypothetical protein
MIYGIFQIDESEVLDRRGETYITVGDLMQEITHLRAELDRARSDNATLVATSCVQAEIKELVLLQWKTEQDEIAQARKWAAAWKFCAKSLWVLSSRLAVFCDKHVPPESYGHMRDLPAGEQCPYCELAQAREEIGSELKGER